MMHNTCRSLIGFFLGSKRRFVFRALPIYIYHTPPFSFLHFQLKHIARALPSTLSESNPFNTCTRHQLNRRISLIHRFGEYFLFTSLAIVLFIFLDFYTHPLALLDPLVLGFVVTCRQCLVRQVTSQSFMTGWITRKYTRPVTKTKRVQAKRGVRPPLPRPQQMRIWRWQNQRMFLMTARNNQKDSS